MQSKPETQTVEDEKPYTVELSAALQAITDELMEHRKRISGLETMVKGQQQLISLLGKALRAHQAVLEAEGGGPFPTIPRVVN